MAWPQATDFSAAIQNPSQSFRDPELLRGQPATDMLLGLPLMYSGNFASVFKVLCPGDQAWAVKCFTRPVSDLQDRYQRISDHLDRQRRKFAVEFVYLPEGIAVKGAWYPVLKMRWVEGFTLNEFLRDHADQPALLDQLGQLWLRLAGEMREARMAHGDLQHGNVMLVPGSKSTSLALRLIDYDGLWLPDLATKPPGEVGHPNYQHPERLASGGYSAEIDRFSHLVIFTAFRALMAGGKALWDRHDNGENLLFRAADFSRPGKSKLLGDLFSLPGNDLRALVGHLIAASQRPLAEVPLLTEIIEGFQAMPVSTGKVDLLRTRLPGATSPPPTTPLLRKDPTAGLPDYLTIPKTILEAPAGLSSPPAPLLSTKQGAIGPTRLEAVSDRPASPIAPTRLEMPPAPPWDLVPPTTECVLPPALGPAETKPQRSRKVSRNKVLQKAIVTSVAGLLVVLIGVGGIIALSGSRPAIKAPRAGQIRYDRNQAGASPKQNPVQQPVAKTFPRETPITPGVEGLPQKITNSIGMQLVRIPAGKFRMGSPSDEKDRSTDEDDHYVEITKPFYLGVYEVTQGEYEKVMGTNPSYFTKEGGGKAKVDGEDTSRFPVETVSYEDAVKFCAKLSGLPIEKEKNHLYRLPTEAEWEYSCRGGAGLKKTPFHFGTSLSSDQANFNGNYPYGRVAKSTYLERTCKVGSYKPNGFGLYDMHGNVWEWCSDWYGMDYYGKAETENPTGPSEGSDRVLRGGSWFNGGSYCRSAYRDKVTPTYRGKNNGFRVVLVPSQRDGVIEPKAEVKKDPPDKPEVPKKEDVITNSIGMKLAYIPKGKFSMGSPKGEADRSANEGPEHEVEITKGFHLGIFEVTQGEFKAVMGYNPSYFSRDGTKKVGEMYFFTLPAGGKDKLNAKDDPDKFPVENVSYEDAVEFCVKLSGLAKEKEKKRRYRLPTEAEWEYACRGGAGSKIPFHFGKTLSSDQANFNGGYPYGGAAKSTYLERTCQVGSFEPNGYGLFDMHGNVVEWCSDWYGEKYYADSPLKDPVGPPQVALRRVVRGGSWFNSGWSCRSASRFRYSPTVRYQYYGFRVALVPSQ